MVSEIDEYLQALRNINKNIERLSDDWPYGLHLYRQFLIIILIEKCSKQKPLNLTLFSSYLSISAATMTRYSKNLELTGWVIRKKRGRETLLYPTVKTLKLSEAYIESVKKEFSIKSSNY